MKQLLVIREHLLKLYQAHAGVIKPLFRFLLAILVFASINRLIGYHPALRSWYVIVLLALTGIVLPASALLLLASGYAVVHIYYVSIVLALVLALVFLLTYFVYIRFAPEHGYAVLAAPVLFILHIPYALPLVLGLVSAPIAIIPMSCGVFFYYILESMTTVIGTATEDSILLYNQAVQLVFSDREMYLTIIIFAMVLVAVYLIRNMEFNYAYGVSVIAGVFINIILFLAMNIPFEMHVRIPYLLLQTVLCGIMAGGVRFFRMVLNYTAVEYLQFEDDEYYYYVKAVPKVSIPAAEVKVKRFNAHLFGEGRRSIRSDEEQTDER